MSDWVLNEAQQQAAEQTEGIVRVIAGAGSGKTRTLTSRFAWLTSLGILPSSICCVTFTNKAAGEMKRRIHAMTADEDTGTITTFHGLCSLILSEEANAIHYPKSFMVLDTGDIDEFLKMIYEERNLSSRDMTFSKARDMIEARKCRDNPEYRLDLIEMSVSALYEKYQRAKSADDIIFYGYLYQQKKSFALDYDDLILMTLYIFQENPEIAEKWQQRFEYILCDEFQDIDDLEYHLLEVLAKGHGNLFVVGDPDQTIYTWRGARQHYLMDFDKRFPGCQTFFLNENYRSTPQILAAANSLISHNENRIKKDLVAVKGNGPKVHAGHFPDADAEAKSIARSIEHLLSKGYALQDIAVIYRAHYMSRPIEEALMKAGIPYSISSGVPFFSRKEIKDALSYARMLVYQDDLDFLRTVNVPRRNIGKSRIAFLQDYAASHDMSLFQALKENLNTEMFAPTKAKEYIDLIESIQWQNQPVSQSVSKILDASGYEKMLRLEGAQERLDNLAELKQSIAEYEISWGEDTQLDGWLKHAALATSQDGAMEADKVRLMTIHTAKGLEFDCVFLPGMNEGMFPTRQVKNLTGMEEERRLAFVAMTRAKRELFLSEAEGSFHGKFSRLPSRFVLEVDENLLEWNPVLPDEMKNAALRSIQARSMAGQSASQRLAPGDVVEHKVFGKGTILRADEGSGSYVIQFDKLSTQRTLSMGAPLKKVSEGTGEFVLH